MFAPNADGRMTIVALLVAALVIPGCRSNDGFEYDPNASYPPFVQQVEFPASDISCEEGTKIFDQAPPPTVRSSGEAEKWPLTLDESIQIALENSQVIRAIGGRVVSAPTAASTIYDPAIQEADPRLGVEAALSAFDAQLTGQLFTEQSDQAFNNVFQASSGTLRNLGAFLLNISKTGATGTQYSLQNTTSYSRIHNFNPGGFNLFPSTYNTVFEAGVRHPLLQGGGVEFNRIAGPNATPGNYNGVLIARINTDISIADFETAVRNLIRDIEQTYWELYFSYRNFDANSIGRQLALESWELEKRRADAGLTRPDQEAFAREQYYAAQVSVENALSGNSLGSGGIYAVERQLRSLLGVPASDGRVIVPIDGPLVADVRFDWHESLAYSLTRRTELRRQQWLVKRRELELVAARNFERMRVDLIGQYRWRGFGDDLLGNRNAIAGSAFDSLYDGNLQDWRVGVEISTPVGNRAGHAAVRHAELLLVREHAVYDEIERQISQELRGAYTELDRAYAVSRSNHNRRIATLIRLAAERRRNMEGNAELDLVLDAQRQAVTAESDYYRAIVDYNLALMNLHFSRGGLLDRHGVRLSESAWSDDAHRSADKLARRFWEKNNYCVNCPADISLGTYPQQVEGEELPPLTSDESFLSNPDVPEPLE
jgi:outer membrane protein TolC